MKLLPSNSEVSVRTSQKVQLIYKLFLLENARSALTKELDEFANKAYQEVQEFLNSSFPTSAFKCLLEALDEKCQAIEKLSQSLRNMSFTSQEIFYKHGKMSHDQPKQEKETYNISANLKNTFIMRSLGRAVQVLGASLHFQSFKYLVIPRKRPKKDHTILNQTTSLKVQEKDTDGTNTFSMVQVTEFHKEEGVGDVEALLPATAHKLLLPPIPVRSPEGGYTGHYVGVPMMKWGREDDIQLQHQMQTSSQLLRFLRAVKAKSTGVLNVLVLESSNYFLELSPPPNMKKQEDAAWPHGILSETENHAPLFKLKCVDSGGSLTYTCIVATKTELWDLGDIITDIESENFSVSSDEMSLMPPGDTLQWADAAVLKYDGPSVKVQALNSIAIPEFRNKRFEEIEIEVTHIVNPGNFYIQHADAEEKLQRLITDTRKESRSFSEQNCVPDIGTQVMGWFSQQKQWCRSQVTKICGINKDHVNSTEEMSITVEVKRLDYGDSFCLSLSNITEMTSEMAVLPLQAVQVSLAHVTPVNGQDWSEEAVDWFRDMVHKRTLYARVYPEEHKVSVELFLEKGNIQAMR
ncbi:unnamed protein product [Knipowitschia caucasica]